MDIDSVLALVYKLWNRFHSQETITVQKRRLGIYFLGPQTWNLTQEEASHILFLRSQSQGTPRGKKGKNQMETSETISSCQFIGDRLDLQNANETAWWGFAGVSTTFNGKISVDHDVRASVWTLACKKRKKRRCRTAHQSHGTVSGRMDKKKSNLYQYISSCQRRKPEQVVCAGASAERAKGAETLRSSAHSLIGSLDDGGTCTSRVKARSFWSADPIGPRGL